MINSRTTYHEDYNEPHVQYFPVPPPKLKLPGPTVLENPENCFCREQLRGNRGIGEQRKHEEYNSYEWSRVGPMGLLLEPRLYGVNRNSEYRNGKCGDSKNWMKLLQESPGFTKVALPYHDMLRLLHEDRLKTTYQVDYDHLVEYPSICYDEKKSPTRKIKKEIKVKEPPTPPYIGGHDIPGRPPRRVNFTLIPELPVVLEAEKPKAPQGSKSKNPRNPQERKLKNPSERKTPQQAKTETPASKRTATDEEAKQRKPVTETQTYKQEKTEVNPIKVPENVQQQSPANPTKVPENVQQSPQINPTKSAANAQQKPHINPKRAQDNLQQKTHKRSAKNPQGNLNNQPPNPKPWTTTYCEVYCYPADKILKDKCLCSGKKRTGDDE